MNIEEHRTRLIADLEKDRLDLMEVVRQLGNYSAQFLPWDEVQAGDIVLVQPGLAEVLAEGPADPEPEIIIRWRLRSMHNGAEYELSLFRAVLTAVVRPAATLQEKLRWHKGTHTWSMHDGYPRHQHSVNGVLTIAPNDTQPHFIWDPEFEQES